MCTPVNLKFTVYKWGLRGSKLYRRVFVMSLPRGAKSVQFSKILSRRGFMCRKAKKSKRKVQEVPQLQTAALPRPQEEEEIDKSKQAQIEQTHDKHQD